MTRFLVLALILGGACKKEEKIQALAATAKVVGTAVAVTAVCTNFVTLSGGELGAASCKDGKATLEIPVDKLGKGKQTFHVRGSNENGRTMAETDLTVDISLTGQAPYLRVTGCESDNTDNSPTSLDLKIGDRTERCRTFNGANAKLVIEANPNAKLTVAGKTETLPESGKLTLLVDLTEPVLALKLADVAVEPESSSSTIKSAVSVSYSLGSDGKTLDGRMEFSEVPGSEGDLGSHFLAQLAAGKGERGGFTPAKPGERRSAGWVSYDGKLRVTDRSGTLRDLDLIAAERETTRTESGTCTYVTPDRAQKINAKRTLVDSELVLMNLADGTVEKRAFAADPDNCSQFAMMDRKDPKAEARVAIPAVTAWIESLVAAR
ncbi:MAG: hypothetical protein IPQ07_37030 [Myxococcales bacterium]|nr:hypothetical protein [Myxococcales bacterium]